MTRTGKSETGFAEVNGARLYYEVAGEGHPLVLIHGGLVHSGLWDGQFEEFARRFRVIRYDARGYGKSSSVPGAFRHYEDLRELLRSLGVDRAHVIGLSMGGGVALELALEHPEMVASLVLVGTGVESYGWSEEIRSSWEEAGAAYKEGDKDRAVEITLRMYTDGPRRNPGDVDSEARERIRAMTAYNASLPEVEAEELELEPSSLSRLPEISALTLVVLGDQDVRDILEIGALLHSGIAGAELVMVEDAAHHLNVEKPAEFNRIVLEFLKGVSHRA